MSTQINNVGFFVNGDQVAYEADSLEWIEGKGEYMIRNAVIGGGLTEQIFSEDIKTKVGSIKISLPTTVANLALSRSWKVNKNNNVCEIVGTVDGEDISRIFTQAAITNDPTNKAATEGTIDLEWTSNPAQ